MRELHTLSVLVLEDEFIIAMDLQDMLAGWGFGEVRVAHDAGEAETLLANGGADLLIADFQLGAETSLALILAAQAGGSAVVVLTGRDLEPQTLERIGYPPVIQKPVQPDTLRRTVMGILERR